MWLKKDEKLQGCLGFKLQAENISAAVNHHNICGLHDMYKKTLQARDKKNGAYFFTSLRRSIVETIYRSSPLHHLPPHSCHSPGHLQWNTSEECWVELCRDVRRLIRRVIGSVVG